MDNHEYGKVIERLIKLSKQKNYSLAKELGYDVSYISKWINLSMLPAEKNIKEINEVTAKFIVDMSTESSKKEIISYFNIDENIINDEILIKYTEKNLNEAYIHSYNKVNKKVKMKKETSNNSIWSVNPYLKKKHLTESIFDVGNLDDKLDIIISCNLSELNREDKMYLLDTNREVERTSNTEIKMKFLMNFKENDNDVIFDVILLIRMLTSVNRVPIELYSIDSSVGTLMAVVKDKYAHTAIYNNQRCLSTITSMNLQVVDEMYQTLNGMIKTQGKRIYDTISVNDMILDQYYMKYIMSQEVEMLLGEINELFMPSELFFEVAEMVFGNDEKVIGRLRKMDSLVQNAAYNSTMNILIYENTLKKYVSDGEMTFFNIPVKLNVSQRIKHIKHMLYILRNNSEIRMKFIEKELLGEAKWKDNPSIYLSRNMVFLKEKYNKVSNNYLVVNDKSSDKIMKKFFNEVWNNRSDFLMEDKEDCKKELENIVMFLQLMDGR